MDRLAAHGKKGEDYLRYRASPASRARGARASGRGDCVGAGVEVSVTGTVVAMVVTAAVVTTVVETVVAAVVGAMVLTVGRIEGNGESGVGNVVVVHRDGVGLCGVVVKGRGLDSILHKWKWSAGGLWAGRTGWSGPGNCPS